MTVVHLKPRHRAITDREALEAVDQALGAEFVRLGELYGPYVVTTVAMKYVTQAIERVRLKRRPTADAWIRDLARRFNDAMRRKL